MYHRNTDPKFWETDYSQDHCNCGSFALDLTSWFSPYCESDDDDGCYTNEDRNEYIIDMYQEGYSREYIKDTILRRDGEEILRICPWLEQVNEFHLPANERIIAYRLQLGDIWNCDVDTDFHFRVRIGGFWFEKCGEGPIHLCSNQEVTEPWVTSPCLIYDSDILYFRVKEKI